MITITPNYYDKFKCIADKCNHSCCIGWEIDIDDVTLQKYDHLETDFSKQLKLNIQYDEFPHFQLDQNERCPFLNKQGLCDIITNLGEDMLCQICSDHPRFRNYFQEYEEIGLGLCCESAAKIILTSKEKTTLNLPVQASKLPIIKFRENIFGILQDREFSIEERVENLLSFIGAQLPCNIDWYCVFSDLEKMDNTWNKYLLCIKGDIDTSCDTTLDTAYEQLLVYLIFRHLLDSQYDNRLTERILFAVLIYKTIKKMNVSNTLDELLEIARIYSCEIEYSDQNIDTILSKLSQ